MKPRMAEPTVSVVIPTFHRPALLARCLAAVLAQRAPAGGFEVIVVDDGHDDATRRQVEALAAASRAPAALRYLRPARGAARRSRATAAGVLRGRR